MKLADLFKSLTREKQKPLTKTLAPVILKKARDFESAFSNRINNSFNGAVLKDINQTFVDQLKDLKARSRFLVQNSSLMNSYVLTLCKNVIGSEGITFKAKTLQDNGTPDTVDNDTLETAWYKFADNPTVQGTRTLKETMSLIVRSLAIDGEAIVLIHEGFRGNPDKIAVQLLDTALLDVTYNLSLDNGTRIICGIEFNEDGKPLNYYFRSPYGTNQYSTPSQPNQFTHTKIPANRIMHLFTEKFVGAVRGYPELGPVMTDARILDNYIEAELNAANNGASLFGAVTRDDNAPAFKGDGQVGEDANSTPQYETQLESGTIMNLAPGQHLELHTPQHPTTQFEAFVKANQKTICAALGLSYATVVGDYSDANYSSLRAAALSDRETYKVYQDMIIEKFLMPLYKRWLAMQISAGNLKLPIAKITKFQDVAFYPRGWDWVDPTRDMQAFKIALELGLTSRTKILSQKGADVYQIFDELAAEQQAIEQRGLQLGEPKPTTPQVQQEQSKEKVAV